MKYDERGRFESVAGGASYPGVRSWLKLNAGDNW